MKSRRKRAVWNSMKHLSYYKKWKFLEQHCTEKMEGTNITFAEKFKQDQKSDNYFI